MKKRKTLIWMLSLVCLLVVGIGFAAIQKTLTIDGTVTIAPNTAGFVVEFEEGTTGAEYVTVSGQTATITIDNAENFVDPSDSITIELKIANKSTQNFDASVAKPVISNVTVKSGESALASDITVATNWGDAAKTITKTEPATFTVTVTLNRAQIADASFEFSITFTATAVQPNA